MDENAKKLFNFENVHDWFCIALELYCNIGNLACITIFSYYSPVATLAPIFDSWAHFKENGEFHFLFSSY